MSGSSASRPVRADGADVAGSQQLTVGLDIGTTSVKAVAVDGAGRIVARSRIGHALHTPSPRRLEVDAAEAWYDGVRAAYREVDAPGEVAAVAVTAMVPSLCAVDDDGRPVSPGLFYGDERGRAIGGKGPGQDQEAVGFLRWLAEQYPDARGYWPAQTVANHALTGRAVLGLAPAASLAPLFTGAGWDQDVLASCGVRPDQLPEIGGLGDACGELPDGTVLGSDIIDALGEQLVSGATRDGDVLVMCGGTLLTWTVIEQYREVEGLWTVPYIAVPDRFLVGGASNAGGLFLDWVRRLVPGDAPEPAPDAVPVWEPYPRGERTPLHDPGRRAALHDLDLTQGPGAILRGAYEAQSFVVRQHIDLAGQDVQRIVATGGGTRDPRWMQALADGTGLPVDVSAIAEGSAVGAAYVARMAAGLVEGFEAASAWVGEPTRVEPRPEWREHTEARYHRFRDLSGI